MRELITCVSLICVIGTALAGIEGGQRSASRREGAIIDTLSREPRSTNYDECGARGPLSQTRIARGKDANVGEFPWHVGVYRTVVNKPSEQDCGGTLISRTLVLTAAHCFWDDLTSKMKPHTMYKIAAGKHLRDWNQIEQNTQIRDVAEINVPRRYLGRNSNYQYDIAVVRMASGVEFNAWVLPVCMDWTKRYKAVQLSDGKLGTTVGWGVTLDGVASQVLQKVDLPFVDFDTCFGILPKDIKKFYTNDKFCAGFANQNRSVCTGDSGGGLTFETRNRYYLRGVVSVNFKPAANRDPCYSQLYTGFTKVSEYMSWIKGFVDNEQAQPGAVTPKPPKKTKSQEMCELYSTAVYDSVELPSSDPIKMSTCAMSPSGVSSQRLVSQPREFPHMAAIGYFRIRTKNIKYLCIGNLISELFVLTAAHCITSPGFTLSHVRLGAVKLKENSTEPGLKIVGVERTYLHPEYDSKFFYNDVGLLKLNETVSFNGYVRPACLDPNPSLLDQETVTTASWDRSIQRIETLLNGNLNLVGGSKCRQIWANLSDATLLKLPKGITPASMLCYNSIDTLTERALISASPLMVKLTDPFCMYRIVGIVTVGPQNYESYIPSVSMRISAFAPWIESVVWPTPDDSNVTVASEITPPRPNEK